MKVSVKILLLILCVLTILIALVGTVNYRGLHAPLNLIEPTNFEVNRGDNLGLIAAALAQENILPVHHLIFKYYGVLTRSRGAIKAGEYELVPGINSIELMVLFRSGKVKQRQITFPEGWTFVQWLQLLGQRHDIKQTIATRNPRDIMKLLGNPRMHPEGQFSPDTYHYAKNETDLNILQWAMRQQQKVLQQEWSARTVGAALEDIDDALILASIVEKESGYGPDRELVARVFLNRLAKGIRLQSDPTTIYGIGEGFDGNLNRRDLKEDQPYNTYVIKGLPPTPICMPGLAAIRATLRAAPGDVMYFVAKGDGRSQFSVTLKEHNEAVRHYQLGERAANYRSSPD